MTRSSPLTPSFNAGEISPRLAARLDFSKYPAGMETCQNFIPLAEGGLMRRSGTRYIATVKDSAVKGRLLPFQYSTIQAYIVEAGEQVFRFCRYQGQIIVPDTDGAITDGDFSSGITTWDDRSTGLGSIAHDATNERMSLDPGGTGATDIGWAEQDVTITGAYTAVEHVLKFRVIGAPSDRVQLRVGTTSTGNELIDDVTYEVGYHCVSFTPNATTFYVQFRNLGSFRNKVVQIDDVSLIDNAAVEVQTPYTEADLYSIVGAQSADVLYLFHPDYPTFKLERFGHTDWSVVEVAWQDGPWGPINENVTATTLTPSATSGLGVTVTASSTEGINDGQGFLSTDVRRLVRIDNPAAGVDWGWGVIVSVTSTTVVVVDVRRAFGATTADDRWMLGEWSDTDGWPAVAAFYQQRLLSANTGAKPQTFWGSNTADFENMSPDSENSSGAWDGTVQDDDALDYTISADTVQVIRWLSPSKNTLAIGTVGGEWVVSSTGSVITPSDVVVDPETSHGSASIRPLRVGNVVLFVQRAKRKIREMAYDFSVDGFLAFDMTRLAEHISRGGIVEMAWAEEPNALVWAVRNDGTLLSMTYRRQEDVVGWARHVVGGSFGSGNAVVESVATIPGADGAGQTQSSENRDEVWVIVKRTINGATARYIEMLETDWDSEFAQEDAYYSDSLITYDGAAASTITGLDHLEGETVRILADGAVHPDKTVASGSITLDASYSVVQVGLGFTHSFKSLKVMGGTAAGTPVGKTKQIFGVSYVFLNGLTLAYGASLSDLKQIDFREVDDLMDTAVPYYSGELFREWDGDYEIDPRIFIQSDDPAPFSLLALAPEIDVRESRG